MLDHVFCPFWGHHHLKKFFLFIFWTVLGLCRCLGFSLAAALGLLITVVSSLADHRLSAVRLQLLQLPGFRAQA